MADSQELSGGIITERPLTVERASILSVNETDFIALKHFRAGTKEPRMLSVHVPGHGEILISYPWHPSVGHEGDIVEAQAIASLTAAWLSSNLPATQIEKALALAAEIFEDAQFAKDWLNRPNPATDDKPPIALLGTEEGLSRVEMLLHRIEYGILA